MHLIAFLYGKQFQAETEKYRFIEVAAQNIATALSLNPHEIMLSSP
jgi:hypothetical protein